jgi:PAS domain S-box-containing protein
MDGDGQEGEDTPVTEGAVVVLGDEALARAARTNGHDIRVASDTEELLDLVTAGTDAVLVGSSPGGLTAVEVTALVRDRHPTVPVVVTAADKRRRAAAAAAGATDTLPTADPEAVTGALSAATGERAATADPDRVDEHRRRRELERYEAIVESIDDSTFVVGADGTLEYVNTRLSDQAGMSESALVGAEVRSLAGALTADPEGLDRFEAALTAVQTGDRDTARLDLELVLPDGPAVADFGLSALDSATGERKVVGVARDVTEQRERRRELEEFEAVLETVNDAVFILDEALEVEYANGEAADRAGYPRPELRGMDALALATPLVTTDTAEHELRAALTAVRDGESEFERLELPLDLPGGHTVTDFQFSALSVGGERKVIAIGRDITALKRRERELREEQTFTETVLDTVPDVFYALDEHGNAVR